MNTRNRNYSNPRHGTTAGKVILVLFAACLVALYFCVRHFISDPRRRSVRDRDYQVIGKVFPRRMPLNIKINKMVELNEMGGLVYSITCEDKDPSETMRLNGFRSLARPSPDQMFVPYEVWIHNEFDDRARRYLSLPLKPTPLLEKAYEKETPIWHHPSWEKTTGIVDPNRKPMIETTFLLLDDRLSPSLKLYMFVGILYEECVLHPLEYSEERDAPAGK